MTIRVAFFSSKSYEEKVFEPMAHDLQYTFIKGRLDSTTASICHDVDAVCVFVNDIADADVISQLAAQGVKHIALRCAGFNNVDLEAARQHGIAVSRVPAYSPEAVAEHTLALMLTLNRKMHKAYNRVREGNFDLNGLLGFNLHGKTVGIVGTGHIGLATAKILTGFGCKLLCHDPYPSETVKGLGGQYVDFETLLSDSHIITLHCPLNEQSYHMINEHTVALMRDNVMLINTSRGGLIDTHAVIKGLKSNKIGYLGLDVYEMESELFFQDRSLEIIHDDVFERLATFHNVLITGHQGFFTREALDQIASTTIANISGLTHGKTKEDTFLVKPS